MTEPLATVNRVLPDTMERCIGGSVVGPDHWCEMPATDLLCDGCETNTCTCEACRRGPCGPDCKWCQG